MTREMMNNIKRAKEERSFEGQVLNIYNSEDYICDTDGDVIGIIDGFEELTGATVNYYTFDTNETMYNQFILQKFITSIYKTLQLFCNYAIIFYYPTRF